MDTRTFKGGVHVPHHKEATEAIAVSTCPSPDKLFFSMRQHIGAPAKPLVAVGDRVFKGQRIGEAGSFVSSNIHSSVSGTVKRIYSRKIMGADTQIIEIENDHQETWDESIKPRENIDDLSAKAIRELISESGVVGMGGAGFPFHVKVSPPEGKTIDTVILNGAECEPFLTGDHRLMVEDPDMIVQGVLLTMRSVGAKKGIIGIEDNKPDAIEAMKQATSMYDQIEVIALESKYPQGGEKQLIKATTDRVVPSGALPLEVGVVVCNVASAKAVADYIITGTPLIERICTVTGSGIKNPGNFLIKIGTPIDRIIEHAGGVTEDFNKLILGGPMMGNSVGQFDFPATKTTGGLLLLNKKDSRDWEVEPCIKCGKCVSICPMFLEPLNISAASLAGDFELAEEFDAMDCIECGSCSFICPANRPLVHSIRVAKRQILEKRKR